MAREKATITVDRAKLAHARAVLGVATASAAIDVALTEVIRRARIRQDIEGYRRVPPTSEEGAIATARIDWFDLDDDTDWEAEWPAPR